MPDARHFVNNVIEEGKEKISGSADISKPQTTVTTRTVTDIINITPTQQMIASSTGAFITSLTMTPLDVVKIRLQSQARPTAFAKGSCFLYCNGLMDHLCSICTNGNGPPQPCTHWYRRQAKVHLNGTYDAFFKIARHEGVSSLWSGLPPTLVMAIPATVVYFTCYEQLRRYLGYREDVMSDKWKPLVAGATARVWAASLTSPVEMVRTKMQSEQMSYTQLTSCIKTLVKTKGVRSLWRGLGPTLLRDVPFSALYWGGYETSKSIIMAQNGHTQLNFYQTFLAGAGSGSIAAIITLPFDVIKTRRQIDMGHIDLVGGKQEVTSTWQLIGNIYRQEGARALYTGLLPRLMKVAPACAIMISSYEFFKGYFIKYNSENNSENNSEKPCSSHFHGHPCPQFVSGEGINRVSGNDDDEISENEEEGSSAVRTSTLRNNFVTKTLIEQSRESPD